MNELSSWAAAAVGHVDRAARGGPIDRPARGGPIDADLRVTLNFHPDRSVGGIPILRAMAADGTYRSQFETGTGNGGLTAHPGGARWVWSRQLTGST